VRRRKTLGIDRDDLRARKVEMRGRQRLTLGLSELSLLNTGLDSLVELAVKSGLTGESNFVVGQYIFLDRLATVMM
jgi:hypothetical protein